MIELRNLPGVQRVTDLTRNPRAFDYPQVSYTMGEIESAVVALFGVCDRFLRWVDEPDDDTAEKQEWEAHFKVADLPWDQARPFWEAIGWDVSDGQGNELVSAHWFARPIIAAVKQLDEDAHFTPDGSGEWPSDDAEIDAIDLEAILTAEADRFLKGRSS